MADETKSELPASTEDTSNTALDVVSDLTLDSTIPAPIRRNMFKAFDRLCSALIDVPVGALERRSAEKRAESEARIKIIRENADQIAQQTKVDPAYALRAGHKFAEKIIREQLNLDKISAIAADEVKKATSAESANQSTSKPDEAQSADSTNQETDSREEKVIDDDWLNKFETEARQVSTAEMQRRFGRVLAGEIEKPGSCSLLTLKTLGELDQDVAALFKRLCSLCVVVEDLCDEVVVDARVVSIEGDAAQNALRKYGLGFDQLNVLNEYRLIVSDYNSWHAYRAYGENENNLQPLLLQHQGKYWDLSPLSDQIEKQDFQLSGVALSRVGRELFHIVDQDPIPEYTEALKEFFAKQNLNMIEANSP